MAGKNVCLKEAEREIVVRPGDGEYITTTPGGERGRVGQKRVKSRHAWKPPFLITKKKGNERGRSSSYKGGGDGKPVNMVLPLNNEKKGKERDRAILFYWDLKGGKSERSLSPAFEPIVGEEKRGRPESV